MDIFTWILLALFLIMYLEGCLFTGILSGLAAKTKLGRLAIVMLWPVAMPVVCYKLYKQYGEVVQQLLPLLVGGSTQETE